MMGMIIMVAMAAMTTMMTTILAPTCTPTKGDVGMLMMTTNSTSSTRISFTGAITRKMTGMARMITTITTSWCRPRPRHA
jgi:hypothetical protein